MCLPKTTSRPHPTLLQDFGQLVFMIQLTLSLDRPLAREDHETGNKQLARAGLSPADAAEVGILLVP